MKLYLPNRKSENTHDKYWEVFNPFRGSCFFVESLRNYYTKYALPIIGEKLEILSAKTPIYGREYIYTTNDIYGGVQLDKYIGTLYIIGSWISNDQKSMDIITRFSNYKDFLNYKDNRFNIGYMTSFKNILEDEKIIHK